jgi:PAS domain S-box-containing protein
VARGYRSLGVFPLKIGEKVIGAVSFYSALPHFFTPDKVALLTRLSSHLALALEMAAKEEERQETEDSLRRTSEFLDSILQHAPVPMYVNHRDGSYLLVNPAWEAVCHKNREQALGRSAADLFHPDTARSFTETDQRVLRSGKPIFYGEAIKVRGAFYYFQTMKFPLHNAQGDIEAVAGISIDITELRQAEEALRRSEERYRGIFENAPVGIFQSTLEGRYLAINPALAGMLGYTSPQEVLAGAQCIAHDVFVHPEQRVDILRRLQAGEEVVKTEIPFRRRHGEVRTANAYFRVVREQDRPIHLEGFVEDITERKKAEANLVAEKQFSDTAIDSLPGLFFLLDDQGHLLRWNRNLEEVSGYAPDELLGMKPREFVLGQEKQEAQDAIQEAMRTGEAFLKADFITKDGRQIPHIFTGRRALIGGKTCLVGTGIDVTELRQAEAALALHSLRLNALLELHQLADAPRDELLDFALDAALAIMESEYGWVGLVDEAEQVLSVHAWSQEAMAQCRAADKSVHFPITPESGLWAEGLRRRQAVIVNDYEAPQDGKKGLPEGHVPIRRFVAVPVFDGSRLVAAAAVANKASDYTADDVRAFTSLLNKLWELLRRQQMEQALRGSEAQYRTMVETALEGVWALDAEGRTTYVNHRMGEMLGYQPEEMLGRYLFSFMNEDNRRLAEALWAERRQGRYAAHEFCFERRDGVPLWTIVSSSPLISDAGAFLGAFAMVTDISARKQAEEALRESEAQYRLLVENIPAVVARGYKDWSVDVFDEKIEALTGYPMEAFNSRQLKWQDLILAEDLPEAEAIFRKAYKTHAPYVREYRILTRSGDIRWLQERSQMIFNDQGVLKYASGVLFDITERQQAEAALRASEARFRLVIEKAPEAIFVQTQHRFEYLNPAAVQLYGAKSPEQLLGQPVLDRFDPDFHEVIRERIRLLNEEKQDVPLMEQIHLKMDGTPFQVEVAAVAMPWEGGDGALVFCRDITERKQADAALWESRELLQAVLDNIPARVFWKDTDLRYLGCNPLFARDAGFENPEELLGKDDFAMAWRDQAELYRSDDRAVIESGEPRLLFEEPQITPTGEQIELLTSKVPLRDARGRIVGVLGTYYDITERKRTQEAIRESEESLRQILEMLPVGVWVADTNGVILQANPAARSIWGGARYVGPKGYWEYKAWWRSTGEPIAPEDWALSRALSQGETCLNEVIDIEAFDGARKIILNSALPLRNARGEIIKAIAVNQDITERIAFEERLKTSLREKEVLLKEVHHRVKNNMQIISSLLRLQSDQVSHPEVQGVFQGSQNRIRSMALVHEMLYQSPDLASISFGAYLKNLVNGLFRSFRVDTHQIAFTLEAVDLPLGIDLALSCGLIINELVSNSLKHAFPENRRGEVSISARQVAPEELLLVVRDTGVGLPPDLDIRKTSSLGLRLVTLLVGQINGSVELDSAPGATFVIRFPVKTHHG